MLSGEFFNITTISTNDGKINAILQINADHKIFKGHFPGQPVVPGVCMMQMVKEILESVIGKTTRLIRADNLKFLTVINPVENNIIEAEIKYSPDEDEKIKVIATLLRGSVTYFKMNGIFVFTEPMIDPNHHLCG